MDSLDHKQVAAALLAAPHTLRLALSVRNTRLREQAAARLARAMLGEPTASHPDQLTLPIDGLHERHRPFL